MWAIFPKFFLAVLYGIKAGFNFQIMYTMMSLNALNQLFPVMYNISWFEKENLRDLVRICHLWPAYAKCCLMTTQESWCKPQLRPAGCLCVNAFYVHLMKEPDPLYTCGTLLKKNLSPLVFIFEANPSILISTPMVLIKKSKLQEAQIMDKVRKLKILQPSWFWVYSKIVYVSP